MTNNQTSENSRYWVWRYTIEDNPGDQLQQAIQKYVKLYQELPFLVLVPDGLKLLSPMDSFEVQQHELVPPFRFYFALHQEASDDKLAESEQDVA